MLEDSAVRPGSGELDVAQEDGEPVASDSNIFNLTSWWAVDFFIAFVIYWVAKSRIY
jgi:hypothetical protein